jgi:hypothetical protein
MVRLASPENAVSSGLSGPELYMGYSKQSRDAVSVLEYLAVGIKTRAATGSGIGAVTVGQVDAHGAVGGATGL